MPSGNIRDRIDIVRAIRTDPARAADEVMRLRAMRDRAQMICNAASGNKTALGMGLRLAAGAVLNEREWKCITPLLDGMLPK